MNKLIIIVLIIILGGGLVFWLRYQNNSFNTSNIIEETVKEPTSNKEETAPSPQVDEAKEKEVMEFEVDGGEFYFEPEEIAVKQGQLVKITFNNVGNARHDLVIDEFEVGTNIISPGETDTIEFIANETGSFAFYCSVGNHRALGMEGTLKVE